MNRYMTTCPTKEICSLETKEWRAALDGSSSHQGVGAWIVLYNPDGTNISLSFILGFPCSNNKAGVGGSDNSLDSILKMGVQKLRVHGFRSSSFNSECSLWRRSLLLPTGLLSRGSPESFSSIQFEHVTRLYNKHADALATLSTRVDIPNEAVDMKIIKKTLQPTTVDFILTEPTNEKDWRTSVIQNLLQPSSIVAVKELQGFTLANVELYFQGRGEVLNRAISKFEARKNYNSFTIFRVGIML